MHRLFTNAWNFIFIFLFLIAGFFSDGFYAVGADSISDHHSEDDHTHLSWIIRWNDAPPADFYESSIVVDQNERMQWTLAKPVQKEQATEWVQRWKDSDSVQYIHPNRKVHIAALPDDPSRPSQTYLNIIGAQQAWEVATENNNITIAIVDTGIDLDHPDLKSNLIDGMNLLDKKKKPMDDNGHGTNLAGILAASTNNQQGIAGLLWETNMMPIKALDADGYGDEHKLGEGILYAVDQGADIVVLALGLHQYSPYLREIVDYAEEKGVLLVAAAGNEGAEVKYPAAYPTVLAVGGIDSNKVVEPRSNYGPEVDLVAPWHVFTTDLNGSYTDNEGTSMAAPQVAGAAGLIMAKYPDFTPAQIRNLLKQTAEPLDDEGWNEQTGHGLLRVDRALTMTYRDDMYSDNDQQSRAAVLPVSAEILANIHPGTDDDWFKLTARYPGRVKLNIKTANEQDISQLQLVYTDNEGRTQSFDDLTKDVTIPVSDYTSFIRLSAKDRSISEPIPYQIITQFFMNPDPFEDNDAKYKAYVLPTRTQTVRGTFHQVDDEDWFMMYIEKAGILKLKAYTDTNRMDLQIYIQRENENPTLIDWAGDGETEYSDPIEASPGRYYFRITNYHADQAYPVAGYYFLNVEYNEILEDPNEPNQTPAQATSIERKEQYEGIIDSKEDIDWFTFSIDKESAVDIKLNEIPKDRMMSLKLYDEEQNQLSVDVNLLGYDRIRVDKQLPAGKYYIRLSANQPFNYQMYNLTVSWDTIVAGLRDISGHWAETEVVELKEKNWIAGYENNYFYPERTITRAEAAVVFSRIIPASDQGEIRFNDVTKSHWAHDAIVKMARTGIFTGYLDGSFKPTQPLSRAEMIVILAKALDEELKVATRSPFTDLSTKHWAFPYVSHLERLGWLQGYPDGTFQPDQKATRAEFTSFIARVFGDREGVNN